MAYTYSKNQYNSQLYEHVKGKHTQKFISLSCMSWMLQIWVRSMPIIMMFNLLHPWNKLQINEVTKPTSVLLLQVEYACSITHYKNKGSILAEIQ